MSLAGLTQGPSIDKATTAQVTFVATQDEKRIECKYCGGVHEIEVCRKLQAAQAKRNINVLHARDDELPPPSTSKKSSINSKRFQGKARANPYPISSPGPSGGSNAYDSASVSQPQAPYQHQVRKGTTYYNSAQPYQGQASGRQDGTSSKDGKKYFDPQRKRERDYPRQRGYQGKDFDPDFHRKQGNHRPVANHAVDTNLLRVAGGHYEPQGRVDTYYAMHVQVVDQPEDKFWVRKRWRQAVKKLLRWQQAPRVLFNIQLRVKARYYIDDNIERASTAMWRRVLSILKINRCAGYGCILVPEDLDHDENPAPYKRHKTLYTDQELLEIFNVTTGLDSTSLQPMECDNDLPKLPQLPCMKNRYEDISLSCQVEVLAAYYYEEPGAKYDDVKI